MPEDENDFASVDEADGLPALELDAETDDADWLKTTWDLEIDNIEDLRKWLKRHRIAAAHFKTLPVYRHNVSKLSWLKEL